MTSAGSRRFPEPLRCEADLYRRQHQGDEDGGCGHPGEVIVEEAAVVKPAAEVRVEGRLSSNSCLGT